MKPNDSERIRTASTTRRGFIATVATAAAAVGLHRAAGATEAFAAGSSTNKALVWRLDSHWGYAVGARNRTHCKCRACIGHATNKVFATQSAALAGRIHTYCECQPRAVQITASSYDALFQGANVVDLRHAGVAALYTNALIASH